MNRISVAVAILVTFASCRETSEPYYFVEHLKPGEEARADVVTLRAETRRAPKSWLAGSSTRLRTG